MTHPQHDDEGVGTFILSALFQGLAVTLRYFIVVVPLVTMTLLGLVIMGANRGNDVISIGIALAICALIVWMWLKCWRWQWNRILANHMKKTIQKLYRLDGLDVRAYVSTEGSGRYRVELFTPRGHTDEDILNRLSMVSAGLHAVSITPVDDDDPHDGHVTVYVVMKDVLADVPAPADEQTMVSIKDPVEVGQTIHGLILKIQLWQEHVIIGGMAGRGKSVLANLIIHRLQDLRDTGGVQVWGIDPHRTEFAPRDFDRLARTGEEASEFLTELLDEGHRRMEIMEDRGWKKWDTSAGPAIVVLVDELAAIFNTGDKADKDRKRDLTRAYAELRKSGITVVGMTQTPSAQLLGDLRNNAGIRVAFGCATDDQLGQILGAHWVDARSNVNVRAIPAPTSNRPTQGMCFVVGGEYQTPTLGRVYAPRD